MKRWKFDPSLVNGEMTSWMALLWAKPVTPNCYDFTGHTHLIPSVEGQTVHVRPYTCPRTATWSISCCHIIVHVDILNVNKTLTAIKCESNSDWFKRIFTSFRESKWRNQHKIVKHFYRNRLFKVFLGYIHRPHPFKLLICRRQKQLFAFDCRRRPMCWSQLFWWWP